ncbi:hypothetical protein F5B17DRAFT_435963 [Nemania serpens]|nr:hypothetical protein F5B17DRAFT_435963 [Nemania serpens]
MSNIRLPTEPNDHSEDDSDKPDAHLIQDLEYSELDLSTSLAKAADAHVLKESVTPELMNSFVERHNDSPENDSDSDHSNLNHAEVESSAYLAKTVNVRASKESKSPAEKRDDSFENECHDLDARQELSENWELESSTTSSEASDTCELEESSFRKVTKNLAEKPNACQRAPEHAESGACTSSAWAADARVSKESSSTSTKLSNVSSSPSAARPVGRFTKPGLNTLRSVGGAAKAGFCLLPFAATICAPGSISFSGREKIWLNQTDESLVTVAGLIRRTTDLSTADTNAADYLAFSIDEVAIFRVEVGYSTLPQPAAIIESLKAVEADGAKVIKDLRDFMPRVRNYGMMVQWTIN